MFSLLLHDTIVSLVVIRDKLCSNSVSRVVKLGLGKKKPESEQIELDPKNRTEKHNPRIRAKQKIIFQSEHIILMKIG